MTGNIFLVILITSLATFLSRFLGVVSSENIKETSKIFRWFNCLAYSTLAALIARIVIFPSGLLSEIAYLIRLIAIILSIVKKQNNLAIGNILGSNIANIFGITIIAVLINGTINFYELLGQIDKWLFLVTSLLFFIIISIKLAGKLISLGFILAYMIYFVFLYL